MTDATSPQTPPPDELFRMLVERSADGLLIIDADGRVRYANSAAALLFAGRAGELVGSHLGVPAVEESSEIAIPGGARTCHVEIRATEVRWENRPLFLASLRDITERKQAETAMQEALDERDRLLAEANRARRALLGLLEDQREAESALRENEAHFRTLADSGQALIWTSGLDKRCDYFNAPWLRFTGRTLEQELGDGWADGVHPDDVERCVQTYLAAFDRRECFSLEYRLRHVSGEYRWIVDEGHPRYDSQGNFLGYIGHCLDITPRKRAEAERERLQGQLLQAQKLEAVGRLAGGIAHDFNNLLMGISNYAELAEGQVPPDHPARAYLAEIRADAERSASLTRQLLAFARQQTVAPQVLDLNDTIAGMLKLLRRLIGEDVDLAWQPGANLGAVRIDPSQVDQVLANLLVNARDAIRNLPPPRAGGPRQTVPLRRITIETDPVALDGAYCAQHPGCRPGAYVCLAVSDTGCGMDAETLAHIFGPFFTTKPTGQGSGLGLATVYGIVTQNGGHVTAYSEVGQGTTFKVYLPRVEAALPSAAPLPPPPPPPGRGETVLVVEDEPSVRTTCGLFLQDLGYAVLTAPHPAEALRLAESHPGPLHLLLTDVVLPGMTGRALAERLAAAHPGLRVLYMSGYTADVIAHQGVLEAGIAFLQKPFTRAALAQKVRAVLDGNGAAGGGQGA